MRLTDGQTDGQTNRQNSYRPRLHSTQRGRNILRYNYRVLSICTLNFYALY